MHVKPAKAIIGLGNPGEQYARTRHNLGFMVVDALARERRGVTWIRECHSYVGRCEQGGRPVLLAKPLTFMNLSGQAVLDLMERYRLGIEALVLVLDDVNLPFGRIRIRERGAAGGHNGLESVLQALGNEEVVRVRLGIGESESPEDRAEFVLSDFPRAREADLAEMILKARDAVKTILADGVSKAMSIYNA